MTRANLRRKSKDLRVLLTTSNAFTKGLSFEQWRRYKDRFNRIVEDYNKQLQDTHLIEDAAVEEAAEVADDMEFFVLMEDEAFANLPKIQVEQPHQPVRGLTAGTALFNPDML